MRTPRSRDEPILDDAELQQGSTKSVTGEETEDELHLRDALDLI